MAGESLKRRRKSGVKTPVGKKEVTADSGGDEDLTVEILEKARVKIKAKNSDTAEKNDGMTQKEEEEKPSENSDAVKKEKKKKKKKKTASEPAQENGLVAGTGEKSVEFISMASPPLKNGMENNLEMNRLLRQPRYFSFAEDKCYRCGEPGHHSQDCTEAASSRPCFVCSQLGHDGFNCPQKDHCKICSKVGHVSRDCPNRDSLGEEGTARKENICMRCGRSGHEATKCNRDYDQEDLKHPIESTRAPLTWGARGGGMQLVECFICRKRGHLSCANISLEAPEEVTCYSCGNVGHTGEGCARPRRAVKEGEQINLQTCYICGEGGHFARGCSKANERSQMQSEESLQMGAITRVGGGRGQGHDHPHKQRKRNPRKGASAAGKKATLHSPVGGRKQNGQAYPSKSTSEAEPIKENYGSKSVPGATKGNETYDPFVPSSTRSSVSDAQAHGRPYVSTRTDLQRTYPVYPIQIPQTSHVGMLGRYTQQTTAIAVRQTPFVFGTFHQAHARPLPVAPPVPLPVPLPFHLQLRSPPLSYHQRESSMNHSQDQILRTSSYNQWQQQSQLRNRWPYVAGRNK